MKTGKTNRTVSMWAVFEKQPAQDEIRFLEAHDVLVSWPKGRHKQYGHGLETVLRLGRLGVDA